MNDESLARFLGVFSVGLGLAEVVAAEKLTETLGMEGRAGLVRAYGLRELGVGIGILAQKRPASGWLWARVAGDALDLATLGTALTPNNPKRGNALLATVAVAGITYLDVVCAQQLASRRLSAQPLPANQYGGYPERGGSVDPSPSLALSEDDTEAMIDREVDESFPASDPPGWVMGGSHRG